jgi:hypothetical protein
MPNQTAVRVVDLKPLVRLACATALFTRSAIIAHAVWPTPDEAFVEAYNRGLRSDIDRRIAPSLSSAGSAMR